MLMPPHRRAIGQILLDGGFLSEVQLEHALEQQQDTNELLGKVLVRMGMLELGDVNAVLSVQEHLSSLEQALQLTAGVRQMLGSLLIHAGKISEEQLEQAIAEQKIRGEKLGEVCVSLGFLSEWQLDNLLAYQENQGLAKREQNPLKLGELLISAGHISRAQLDDSLDKQILSQKKLGHVLIEEGYAHPSQIRHGVHLQRLLMTSVLAAVLSLATVTLTGCGGGGDSTTASPSVSAPAGVDAAPTEVRIDAGSYFRMTSDEYGLVKPNFYYSTDNASFWSIQANLAKSVTDIDSEAVFRIDIPKPNGRMPSLDRAYSIEDGTALEQFPGTFMVFNGQKSVKKKVESGVIFFSSDSVSSSRVSGTFEVTLTDYDSSMSPAPQYQLKGSFHFVMGTYGLALEPT